ncbi:hypothetical protein DXX93_15560 [Thalassotalea euphylliae]|uniref:Uncharacterized protein n=1 Tax=Thalassotalea euphylliae TaxID=1655234 RepID=A0A3E0TTV5_9GAMM|nr:hypothetical protein DXX93_15560 [Thalassotalea euphylliae]
MINCLVINLARSFYQLNPKVGDYWYLFFIQKAFCDNYLVEGEQRFKNKFTTNLLVERLSEMALFIIPIASAVSRSYS